MSWIREIRQHRGLIRLLRIEVLCCLLREPIADPSLRSRLVAELTMRGWLLAGGAPWSDLPERLSIHQAWEAYGLHPDMREVLDEWLSSQCQHRSYTLPQIPAVSGCILTMMQKDLGNWSCADGAFPVVSKTDSEYLAPCTLLPFVIDKVGGTYAAGVRTATGESLPRLREGVDQALRVLRRLGRYSEREFIRLTLISLASPGRVMFGRSVGLPVLIAEYIKCFPQRPRCLALCSSGCLADNGQLDRDLSTNESFAVKAAWLKRCGVAERIFPDSSGCSEGTTTWPMSQHLDDCLHGLSEITHVDVHPAVSGEWISARNIEERLNQINAEMRFGKLEPLAANQELEGMSALLEIKTDAKSRRLRLHCEELRAAACCHMGRTRESVALTYAVIQQAGEVGPYYVVEAMVRQAVNMTDFSDYASAASYCDTAIKMLPSLQNLDERMDLELKAVSSKAQALTYWSLIDDSYLEESLQLTLKSVDLAKELDGDYPDNPERNLPRNLTYLYGWYALHKPLESETVRQEIVGSVCGDLHSKAFFIRNRWLSAYRAHLEGNHLDWTSFEDELPDERSGWLWSLSLKYRGTLRAAAGKIDAARADFSQAIILLKQIDSNPLLAFIGATAALQAAESVMANDPEQSSAHIAAALPVIDAFGGWFMADKLDVSQWRARADAILACQSLVAVPNPQLYYLY